ncbi:flagellar protein export ATPase FliI [bacterium]|nr:flagellar protein export ATPase FliI [bacterium]
MSDSKIIDGLISDIQGVTDARYAGRIRSVKGLMLECVGLDPFLAVGSRVKIFGRGGEKVMAEVVGVDNGHNLLMPFSDIQGIGTGCEVVIDQTSSVAHPHENWLGRVLNAFGEPIDDMGPINEGAVPYKLRAAPPPAHRRKRVGRRIDLGVTVMNVFLTCCRGQRMGIFAGSGVGKSTLLSMLARFSDHDVNVIGLIGERGREVQEFIQEYLGEEGLKKSVVIVATSDESALMRKQAAYLTLAVAEYFRDQGKQVLCLMDSVTRFAMALREIGLSAKEPPTTKGYTPTVFAELPRLLERAGPGTGDGMITGLFSVLVEGDDQNEPISDAVRGILDGHIVLERAIAERGRFPAVNVLRSVSRTMPDCNQPHETQMIQKARQLMSIYEDMADLIRLGAYRKGSDPNVDEAIYYYPLFQQFLNQDKDVPLSLEQGFAGLAEILKNSGKAAGQ